MASTIPIQFKFKPPNLFPNHTHFSLISVKKSNRSSFTARNPCKVVVLTRACSNGGQGEVFATQQQSSASDVGTSQDTYSGSTDGYVALFVRMLGLDNDPHDREQAVVALWKYALGGKQCVDNILRFHGIINLTVNLLKLDSDSACEAAAGLLSVISSINVYRDSVAESGAIEEITGLLTRSSLPPDVKQQSICTLWNLSVDEKLRAQIANSELLPLLVKSLEDEDVKVKEAAGGVLANVALSQSNHKILVEAGAIPRLAKLLKGDPEDSKIIIKEARNTLLELAKDEYNRILIMEEGLVLVPLVGAAAYKSFRPALHSWPSLPDGTEIKQSSIGPSRYGASELLVGLNIQDSNVDLEEAKINAVIGRTQQRFLARVGGIEKEDNDGSNRERPSHERYTLLPWIDGVARLVLILELEDESAIARAAGSIADASISEHMRVSFKEAGAIKQLVQLINHPSDFVRFAVIRALERLSVSNNVCQKIEEEGTLGPLINVLKQADQDIPHTLVEMILGTLTRILDPIKGMKSKFYDGPVNGSRKVWERIDSKSADGKDVAEKSTSSDVEDLLDSAVLARLVDILRTSNTTLQRQAASLLEFIAVSELAVQKIIAADVETGLQSVFEQNNSTGTTDEEKPELQSLELEESGLAVSAAARLLTRLLDYESFRRSINSDHFSKLFHKVLVSPIPLENKDWVAACLVKLSSLSGPTLDLENRVNTEVTLYETIPRLIRQIEDSFPAEVQEAAVLELKRIISEGIVNATRAVAGQGAIFPLVKLLEGGSDRAVEASLAILYTLSMDSENHATIISAGAVPALRRIVLSQKPYWMRAIRLLRTLPT